MANFSAARAVATRPVTVRADCHRAVEPPYGGPGDGQLPFRSQRI
jgi:hypothetical protein